MSPIVHGFDPPERFVAGTVGEPGARTFFLQARAGSRVVTVALEKQQVEALAERIDELLDEVMGSPETEALIPAVAPQDLTDDDPLETPITEEFRVGTMTLSWDAQDERVVVEVFPVGEENVGLGDAANEGEETATEDEGSEVLLVRMAAGPARAFAQRAGKVVGAGRPSCPFCGEPVGAEGHLCVRANGFKRREP
ncbi:DUF3090 domain-containing protein [Nocardioides panacisoli]|uniref:DUF3090 domain-containing protein n=1 Tax=Nocardioides panacisoli TaxID=627624 RepID=UPI001C63AD9C|nr:DUF3090 domain-containing protein [Nocardioides panacisoli]QYJ05036.1 DUF3090 domain-containing protein [Nocardioides panacisoli]